MFDILNSSYKKIISSLGIVGYLEEDIKNCKGNDYNKLPLNCLYVFPSKNESTFNSLTYEMMFPSGDRHIDCPKYFTLSLTNEKANHSFLYCLKFSEKYRVRPSQQNDEKLIDKKSLRKKTKSEIINFDSKFKEIYVPIVICIQSEKNDAEPFKQLLYAIHQIIVNDNIDNSDTVVNDYKKIELMNLFYFLFSLPHTSPHTQVSLKINFNKNNNLCENETYDYDLIDFYFCSNCEIPCNKNDPNIDILFKLLDQTIIIKVLFAILTEKQIILRASEAHLLHIIIPTFLKLIFPFVWIQTCITILPKENIEYLDMPGTFIVGILSSTISVNELLKQYPGKIIVDCDTNEIMGEEFSVPFYPKAINNTNNSKKKEDKEKNVNNGMVQGKNTFIIDGCYLYEFDQNFNNINKNQRKKLKIDSKNNIIIDIQNSQLLITKNDLYLNSDEWKWLRKNIQMVRNPEIFDIGNIMKRKNSLHNVFFDSTKESPIIPDRPFSYNIQNILMIFLLNKLNFKESDFMKYFKTSNLYLNYIEPKKYQNNSGRIIVENIKETKNNQRSYNNCLTIEYNLKPFNVSIFLEDLEKKIEEIEKEGDIDNNININVNLNNTNKNGKIFFYKKIRKVLMAYCVVLGISIKQMNEIISEDIQRRNNKSKASTRHKNKNVHNRFNLANNYFSMNNNTLIKEHVKNKKTSIFNFKNIEDSDVENEEENPFSFYGDNGFLNFIKKFEEYLEEEGIEITKIIFQNSIYSQIIHFLKDLKTLLKIKDSSNVDTQIIIDMLDNDFKENTNSVDDDENNNNSVLASSTISKLNHTNNDLLEEIKSKSSSKALDKSHMSIVDEKKEEEDSFLDVIVNKKSTKKLNNFEYDLESAFNNVDKNLINDDGENGNNINNFKSGYIIDFPDFDFEKGNEINLCENQINKTDEINLKSQFYLFLNYYLEEIAKDDKIKKQTIEEIKRVHNIKINFDNLILKIYKLAFEFSDKKHRDFPYFNYYEFLNGLSLENLQKLENNIDKYQLELYDIYNKVCQEKKKSLEKNNRLSCVNTFNSRAFSITDFEIKSSLTKVNQSDLQSCKTIKEKRPSIILNHKIPDELFNRKTIKNLGKKEDTKKDNQIEFNSSKEYIINASPDFDPFCEPGSTHILHELCALILTCFPSKEDIGKKSIDEILNETNMKLNTQTFRELIGELRNIDLKQLKNNKSKMCFWLNCFNFLLLYTIFYKKWNFSDEKSWKSFFKNVKYNISGNNYSFNDMQYIIFQKIYFFTFSYKPADFVKKNIIDNSKIKSYNNNPFSLYIPTKEFFAPIIYEENTLVDNLNKRKEEYLNSFVVIDNNKVNVTELLLSYESSFFNSKILNKYKSILKGDIYEIISKKKYSDISTKSLKWELNFDYLLS